MFATLRLYYVASLLRRNTVPRSVASRSAAPLLCAAFLIPRSVNTSAKCLLRVLLTQRASVALPRMRLDFVPREPRASPL